MVEQWSSKSHAWVRFLLSLLSTSHKQNAKSFYKTLGVKRNRKVRLTTFVHRLARKSVITRAGWFIRRHQAQSIYALSKARHSVLTKTALRRNKTSYNQQLQVRRLNSLKWYQFGANTPWLHHYNKLRSIHSGKFRALIASPHWMWFLESSTTVNTVLNLLSEQSSDGIQQWQQYTLHSQVLGIFHTNGNFLSEANTRRVGVLKLNTSAEVNSIFSRLATLLYNDEEYAVSDRYCAYGFQKMTSALPAPRWNRSVGIVKLVKEPYHIYRTTCISSLPLNHKLLSQQFTLLPLNDTLFNDSMSRLAKNKPRQVSATLIRSNVNSLPSILPLKNVKESWQMTWPFLKRRQRSTLPYLTPNLSTKLLKVRMRYNKFTRRKKLRSKKLRKFRNLTLKVRLEQSLLNHLRSLYLTLSTATHHLSNPLLRTGFNKKHFSNANYTSYLNVLSMQSLPALLISDFIVSHVTTESPLSLARPNFKWDNITPSRVLAVSNSTYMRYDTFAASPVLRIDPWVTNMLTRFVQHCYGKNSLIHFNPFVNDNVHLEAQALYRMWIPRLAFYERMMGHRFFIEEAFHIMHLSFAYHDAKLFASWLKAIITRISFWKTRSIFRFLKYVFNNYLRFHLPFVGAKGIKIRLKGKISAAGNSRKRTIIFRGGKNSYSSVNVKCVHSFSTITTFTGVMGFQVWLFY